MRADDGSTTAPDARVVWVTGASSGIGRAVAHACARRGDRLVLSSRAAELLDDVRRECEELGAPAVLVQPLDISDGAAVAAAADAAVSTFGRLDVVVQNAGVAAYCRLEEMDDDDFDRVLQVNLMGAFRVSKAAIRVFRRQRAGSLVVVGSVLGRVGIPWMGAYVTSKWGLRGLTRVLQAENADVRGIRVTLVAPGGVDTPIYDQSANRIGRRPKPPFPVARPEKVAATVLRAAEARQRELGVGWANLGILAVSSLLPGVWDRIITPAMSVGALSRTRISTDEPARSGNLRRPRPDLEQLRRDPRRKPDGSGSAPYSAPLVNLGRDKG